MNKHTRNVWSLQEAKAKFSEVVERAQTEGPQTVTVHGKTGCHDHISRKLQLRSSCD